MAEDKENNRGNKGKNKKQPKKLSERYLRNAGEFYLNRFPASTRRFKTVMIRKIDRSCRAHPDQQRDDWIEFIEKNLIPAFTELGFLNDDLYSKALYNSLKNKGLSAKSIQSKMMNKGVESRVIQDLLHDDDDGLNENESVITFARKKKIGRFSPVSYADDPDRKRKDLGKLARAGFSYDVAISVLED